MPIFHPECDHYGFDLVCPERTRPQSLLEYPAGDGPPFVADWEPTCGVYHAFNLGTETGWPLSWYKVRVPSAPKKRRELLK
jgi:hypothetical protein